jgi:hypothetical protein
MEPPFRNKYPKDVVQECTTEKDCSNLMHIEQGDLSIISKCPIETELLVYLPLIITIVT